MVTTLNVFLKPQWKNSESYHFQSRVNSSPIYLHTYITLEKEMATHSSTLAWKIPWMEEPGRLQSMGSQRVGHHWTTSLHSLHSLHTLSLEKEMATHSSILAWRIPWTEEPGWATVHGGHRELDTTEVTKHAHTLKFLSILFVPWNNGFSHFIDEFLTRKMQLYGWQVGGNQ